MSGNMFSNAGAIHRSEIPMTVKTMEYKLEMDIGDNVLGSVGKKEYSGDLDFVLPPETNRKEFHDKLIASFGASNVKLLGGNGYTVLVPIVGYNKTKMERTPRTGYVQSDFLFSDNVETTKFFYHSPGEESKYKGAHRTAALGGLVKLIDRKILSKEVDDYDRPLVEIRWKFGSNGLIRFRRESQRNPANDEWMKKTKDTDMAKPITSPAEIAKVVFGDSGTPEDLNSLESIVKAVRRVYPSRKDELFHEIFKALENSKLTDGYYLPPELEKFK